MIQLLTNYSEQEKNKLENIVEIALDAGFNSIQFSWNREDALYRIENVKKLTEKYNAQLCVNNNLELAKKFDADAIHIGPSDISIDKIKKELPNIKIGFSIHPIYYCKQLEFNVDYFGIGPVYKTVTFKGHNEIFGIRKFNEMVQNIKKPICAIGGINLDNIQKIKDSQCESICVAGCIYRSTNPVESAKKLVKYWNGNE